MDYRESIQKHYESIWISGSTPRYWRKGPIGQLNPDFTVLEFAPRHDRDMWTYATCCMSSENDSRPVELHIFSSKQDPSLVELLTAIAYYHINDSKLDLHHTVNFGRSWQDNSECTFGFISLPYLDGPDLEDGLDKTVKFYWLIPVTEKEVELKKKYGIKELENKFEEEGLDYINPGRKSLA